MQEYTLLSGEKINLSNLTEEEQKHISEIEQLIKNSIDYFEVVRRIDGPLKEGKMFTSESLRELYASPKYKVLVDLLEKYRQKTFLKK